MSVIFNPIEIERELTALQRQLSPNESRTMLFNLVIVSREQDAREIDEALACILGKRPARVIHIRNADRDETGIEISARCFPGPGNQSVCLQELLILNGKDGVGVATGSWAPLLIRDIPVYLWWMESLVPPPETLYAALEQVDKVILNSLKSERSGEAACGIFEEFVADILDRDIPVADIAWRKLSALRQTTARLFDPAPVRPLMSEIRRVRISGGTAVTTELYLAWLAHRLDWRKTGEFSFACRGGGTVEWEHGSPSPLEHGIAVTFTAASGAVLSLMTDPERGYAKLSAPGEPVVTTSYTLQPEGNLLLDELDYLYHDYLFAEVIRSIRC
jgi:hypothetical protein